MKILLSILVAALLLSSCPERRLYDAFNGNDRKPPVLLEHELRTNSLFRAVYDEYVFIRDIELDGKKLGYTGKGNIFNIQFPSPLSRGQKAVLSITVEDSGGNTSRSSFSLTGINDNVPPAVINEFSIKGTGSSPDRVEILFLGSGNTAGMELADGTDEKHNHSFTLPEEEVNEGDIFLIYWNTEIMGDACYDREDGITWSFSAGSKKTLSGTSGALILYTSENGSIIDGVVYKNSTSDTNSITEESAYMLQMKGEREGDLLSSDLVTSSRVFARLPEGVDTNTSDDFFITQARKSSFGSTNTYFPYEK